jgi:hypothetical protein
MEPSMLQKIMLGFGFALAAMLCEGFVEIMRQKYAPAPGDYFVEAARSKLLSTGLTDIDSCHTVIYIHAATTDSSVIADNISPCKNIDNYNPYQYQKW